MRIVYKAKTLQTENKVELDKLKTISQKRNGDLQTK